MTHLSHNPTAHALARLAVESSKQFPHRSLECNVASAVEWLELFWKRPITDGDRFDAEDILWRTTSLG